MRRVNASRLATDWDAYHRAAWQGEDTLDPVLRAALVNRIRRALGKIGTRVQKAPLGADS